MHTIKNNRYSCKRDICLCKSTCCPKSIHKFKQTHWKGLLKRFTATSHQFHILFCYYNICKYVHILYSHMLAAIKKAYKIIFQNTCQQFVLAFSLAAFSLPVNWTFEYGLQGTHFTYKYYIKHKNSALETICAFRCKTWHRLCHFEFSVLFIWEKQQCVRFVQVIRCTYF